MELHYPDPPLSDGSVTLRRWLDTDVDCIRATSTDERIPRGTTVPARYTRQAGLSFIDRQHGRLTSGQGVSLAICHQSPLAVGLAILTVRPQAGVAGIGYWVVPAARGHGVATRAIGLVTDWGLDHLGFERIEAWVEPDNLVSRRALEANGYEAEGVLRSFLVLGERRVDVLALSRIRASGGSGS